MKYREWWRATPSAAPPAPAGRSSAEYLPPERPVAMPVQDFRRTPRRAVMHRPDLDAVARRVLILALSVLPALLAAHDMKGWMSSNGLSIWEAAYLLLFIPLFSWIAFGFATSLIGFLLLTGQGGQLAARVPRSGTTPEGRTAILMPVCNEDFSAVLHRLSVMERSVAQVMGSERFDFFILSDSNADNGAAEERAYHRVRQGFSRPVFYRRRAANIGRKPGNIAEWVQRFGGGYDYMVVLDADSVMSGQTIARLALDLERHPRLGLIQTVPAVVGASTLFARWQQFASRLYGPISAAGMIWWSASEGTFWGHNAIIRVQAFAESCGLPELRGPAPFGGHIMSHDMIEASLLRRRGWAVHMVMAEDSFEEFPPSLPDLAIRDRRWCQGNIQHVPLMLRIAGLHPVNRFQLMVGASAYLTSPMWLAMILAVIAGEYQGVWAASGMLPSGGLLALTLVLLFGPKLLAIAWALADAGRRASFGGGGRILRSAASDTLLSILMAPVSMLTQSMNLAGILLGRKSAWNGQSRDCDGIPLGRALWMFRNHVALGVVIVLAGLKSGISMAWLSPIIAGLLLAPLLAALTARKDVGRLFARNGLFQVPEPWWRSGSQRQASARLSIELGEEGAPPMARAAND